MSTQMCRGTRDKCKKKPGRASGNRHCFTETVSSMTKQWTYTAQCYAVQFCQCLSFTKEETITLVKEAYPDADPSDVTIWQWYRDFENGRESKKLKPRSGSKNQFAWMSTLTPSPPSLKTTAIADSSRIIPIVKMMIYNCFQYRFIF